MPLSLNLSSASSPRYLESSIARHISSTSPSGVFSMQRLFFLGGKVMLETFMRTLKSFCDNFNGNEGDYYAGGMR